jgi:hypothetical protein
MIDTSRTRDRTHARTGRSVSPDAFAIDPNGAPGGQLSQDTMDQLVVRAHFLALDLRIFATDAGCGNTAMTALAAEFLRHWAVEAGRNRCIDT